MDLRHNITICTRCKKPLKDLKYYISLKIDALKEKESGAWETIPSLDLTTNEVVCDTCFELFSKAIIAGMAQEKSDESSAS
jgi:hypothetical protein